MITIFVKYTVNLHPICFRICFRKRQNCSARASKMEQFSGGGPPSPRFLPKLSMTVQVNHKKLYYNYYTLGKYLLKIQISGKILHNPTISDALLRPCRLTCTIVEKLKKFLKFLKWPKKDKF
jgi:hypothetical protein